MPPETPRTANLQPTNPDSIPSSSPVGGQDFGEALQEFAQTKLRFLVGQGTIPSENSLAFPYPTATSQGVSPSQPSTEVSGDVE